MIEKVIEHFNSGKLQQAIEDSNQLVAANPRDLTPRVVLAQLVCFNGDWERAAKVVQQLKTLDTSQEQAPLVNFLDAMITAEKQRDEVWTQGALPEFVEPPSEVESKLLWAWNCRRSGEMNQFKESLEFVLENAPACSVQLGPKKLDGLRDLDDMTATIFEAHSIHGAHYWLPMRQIEKLEVSPPTRPIDFLWNSARLKLRNGQEARMYFSGTYFHTFQSENDDLKLGRISEWGSDEAGHEVGMGRKIFVADEDELTFFDFTEADFTIAN